MRPQRHKEWPSPVSGLSASKRSSSPQGECGVFRIDGGGKGPFHGFRAVGAMVNTQPGAPIAMQQPGVRLKLADIADLAVEEMKLSVVKLDVKGIHRSASSAPGNLRERSPFPGGKISKMPTGL